jgi:hypothetical protein
MRALVWHGPGMSLDEWLGGSAARAGLFGVLSVVVIIDQFGELV